jgi:hypothetical protein
VRNEENKPKLLDYGVEPLLRTAKRNHPKVCMDVSSACMRDLGCENYNEGCVGSVALPAPALARSSVGFQQRGWRAAERRHSTGRGRMGSPTLSRRLC